MMDNGTTNGIYEEFDYDDLEVYSNPTQDKSIKAFADQRRKLKPNRKHVRRSNPIKVLQERNDVFEDNQLELNGSDENPVEIKPKKVTRRDSNPSENGVYQNGDSQLRQSQNLIQRQSLYGGVGKIKEREHALTNDAKKGLESKEDIHSASLSLRVTEKDTKTGVGTEKTNIYDGVKEVMLFHLKGGRNVQVRLVEPTSSSMNSGDVFVLVTPKHVFQWNGKNCSILEKAKGAEVTAVIQQWKELGCQAESVHVIDEGHEKPGSMSAKFWKILGDQQNIKEIDDVYEDKEFEKGVLESNLFYEIKCENSEDEEADCWLEQIEKYSGCVPSKKWLNSERAYVFDFGTEVYSWIGSKARGAPRRKAAEMGLNTYNKKYNCTSFVHPFNLNTKKNDRSEATVRPSWSIYGRMAEKTENVAFRRKFCDWPDPVDLKVVTVEAKVHSQLSCEMPLSPTLYPVSSHEMTKPIPEPLMVLDGCFIGRGKGMKDVETLFQYGIALNDLKIWQIAGNTFEELPNDKHGVFYSAEAYVLRWNFQVFRTGINRLKGGQSRQVDTGKDRIIFFFWQGKDCTASEKGQAALRTIELNTDEGPQQLVPQGREPPAFFQLFNGKMIVHSGKQSDDPGYTRKRLYWVRNEVEEETCLVEVSMTSASLRSRSSFILADVQEEAMYIWHGAKSSPTTQKRAVTGAHLLNQKTSELHSKKMTIYEMNEGEEVDEFWDCFSNDEDYMSLLDVSKDFCFTPRCFSFDNLRGYFRSVEITSSSYHPEFICPYPILQSNLYELSQPGLALIDVRYKIYLWEGWRPKADEDFIDASVATTAADEHKFNLNRKLALQSIKAYAEATGRSLSRLHIVFGGCEPLEFKNLFPFWEDNEDATKSQLERGRKQGEKMKAIDVLNQLERDEYTLAELTRSPLPEGVDPTRIEQYLGGEEFLDLFKMDKDSFNKQPRWKQIDLKKKSGLF